MDILSNTHSRFDLALAMTATQSTALSLKKILPHRLVFTEGYDFAYGTRFLATCKATAEKGKIRSNL
jgi:hypothetical protein